MAKKSILDFAPGDKAAGFSGKGIARPGDRTGKAFTSPERAFAAERAAADAADAEPATGAGADAGAGEFPGATAEAPYGYKPDGTPYKRRPGKRGPRKPASKKDNETLTGVLAQSLAGLHSFAASAFDAPEWGMDIDEAQRIADAVERMQDAYGVQVDPRVAATISLGGILAMSYGPRVIATRLRVAREGREKQAPAPAKANGTAAPENVPTPPIKGGEAEPLPKGPATPAQLFGTTGGAE